MELTARSLLQYEELAKLQVAKVEKEKEKMTVQSELTALHEINIATRFDVMWPAPILCVIQLHMSCDSIPQTQLCHMIATLLCDFEYPSSFTLDLLHEYFFV